MKPFVSFKFSSRLLFIILFSYVIYGHGFSRPQQEEDSIKQVDQLTAEERIRGERLFYGLVYSGERSVNCAGCHNTKVVDTINWNPDAHEISMLYKDKSVEDLSGVLLNPRGQKLAEVHADVQLTDEDVVMLKSFMDRFAEEGLQQPKPVINHLLFFIFLLILFSGAIADLIFFKKVKQKWVHLIIILGSAFFIVKIIAEEAIAIGRSPEYSPNQPLKFSHLIHAGENQTECNYCHHSAIQSKSAGIPGTSVCMNCHLIVRSGSRSGTFEIAKVIDSYNQSDPIEWIRVYNLPDHAFFNHAQHVEAGKIACQKCHGPLEEKHRVGTYTDLSMGWCIECHRESAVHFHDNAFYEEYENIADDIHRGMLDTVTVERLGGTECMRCHY